MSTPNRTAITDKEHDFLLQNGYLLLSGILQGEELHRVQQAMQDLTASQSAEVRNNPDHMYGAGSQVGQAYPAAYQVL